MAFEAAAAPIEALRAEVRIELREVGDQPAAQEREFPRRGLLIRIGQAGGVLEHRRRHAELTRLLRHALRELVLVAADRFGNRHGDIVCGAYDERLDCIFDGDLIAGPQAEARRFLRAGIGRRRQRRRQGQCALLQLLEQKVERHHLRERRRIALLGRHAFVENAAGRRIHDERCVFFHVWHWRRIVADALALARSIGVGRGQDNAHQHQEHQKQSQRLNAPHHASFPVPSGSTARLRRQQEAHQTSGGFPPSETPTKRQFCQVLRDWEALTWAYSRNSRTLSVQFAHLCNRVIRQPSSCLRADLLLVNRDTGRFHRGYCAVHNFNLTRLGCGLI